MTNIDLEAKASFAPVERKKKWPIGWSLLAAFGVSSLLWVGIVLGGQALIDVFF